MLQRATICTFAGHCGKFGHQTFSINTSRLGGASCAPASEYSNTMAMAAAARFGAPAEIRRDKSLLSAGAM
jgi:hypothetical protein